MGITDLVERLKGYLPKENLPLIEGAYEFAARAHEGQRRASGDPFLQHPLQTAMILAELQLDATCIAAGLLHDTVEDGSVLLKEIEGKFGPEISKLVDGVTKLSKLAWQPPEDRAKTKRRAEASELQAESLRKMLVSMAEDIRVVLIKLADRLHNMRTLDALPPDRQRRISRETLDIYAPLAHRLGIWEVKWQLEDLAFRHLEPAAYREIATLVTARRGARERFIKNVVGQLREEMQRAGIRADIEGRPKHIYSIHNKMRKYAAQGKDFSDIYDLFAVRVLVDEVEDCYNALGVVHNLWHPVPGQFDDYIANPKDGIYRSLHTTVVGPGGTPLEIQIRTHEMHRIAEYGVAAHWRYKEGAKTDPNFEEKLAWLRQLLEWQRELSGAQEFVESVKTDIFRDQVFVYTPKGDIKELPAGATPLDLAYRIHTDLGHRCIGAKVNGKLVPLNYQLNIGDMVEVLSAKGVRGPSLDWLNPSLGYLKTTHGREKVRQWFNKQERADNIERGREALEKELKRLGSSFTQEEVAHLLKYDSLDDFLAAIGSGTVTAQQIATKLLLAQEPADVIELPEAPKSTSRVVSDIQVLGVGDLLTRVAQCCHPVPGDDIIGYVSRTRGVTVHRIDCPNVRNEDEKERLIKVTWGKGNQTYPVSVRIDAWDRVGLLRDLTTVVSEDKVNMTGVSTQEHGDHTASIFVTLETTGVGQLSRLITKLEAVKGVNSVVRRVEAQK
ncbi:MAG: bifunctional (p)ppGpp synthetase/guanosine-3',5'-bis(diphosphate) 3'-pyrophosphohydrolase [Chloroflexi bacterium]|nr:bifunctional (p)ppGpp synthetase/guanosine-3',5'-bis(diphosphate) 3'-pyrophosphohydrolase [Chloroflexota bacterium]